MILKKIKYLIIFSLFALPYSQNIVVHINSTYYNGTPKEVIIYEYSNLYMDNPYKIIDKLNFDRKGNIIFDYENYFNGQWEVKSPHYQRVDIIKNQIKYLKPSDSCLECHYASLWNLLFLVHKLIIETDIILNFIGVAEPKSMNYNDNSMRYYVEIFSPNHFVIIDYEKNKYHFNKIK